MTAEDIEVLREAIQIIPKAIAITQMADKGSEHLRQAIIEHYIQKADDRCWMDDDKLYAAAGLAPVDRRVGSKGEMLRNCERFVLQRCKAGGWPSYVELEDLIRGLILNSATDTSGLTPKQLELYEKFLQASKAGE